MTHRLTALWDTPVTPAAWDALAARSGNVFGTRQWLETWLDHEPETDGLVGLTGRLPDGDLVALLPLVAHRRRPTVLRPVGPWPPPKGPLTCPADASGVAVREVARKLAARDDWDIVEVEAVPAEQRWGQELRTVTVTRHPNHVLHLAPRTWDELFTASSRNFRSQHGNRRRRLERRYQVTYRRTVDRSTLESDVDTFLALHWQRWGEEVNVLTPARVPFIQDFAEQALERGWLALWFLEVNGQAVAAQLDFRFAGTEVLFMAGSDPAFADDHVGFLIAFHAVREAAEAGVREFHFLRGDEQHKRRLPSTNQPVDHLLFSRTLLGDATIGLSALTRRARSAASSRLRGRSGRAGDS